MKKYLLATLACVSLACATMPAQAATAIDFDDGADGSSVGSAYIGQGVIFSNAQYTTNFALTGSSGPLGIRAPGTFVFGSSNAITALFVSLVNSITIRGIDVGTAGIRIDAFDAANNLIASNSAFGADVGVGNFFDLSVSANGIARFALYQPAANGGDGVLFDNLRFETAVASAVPEPEAWAMLLLGFGIIGGAMRVRRRRQKVSLSYA